MFLTVQDFLLNRRQFPSDKRKFDVQKSCVLQTYRRRVIIRLRAQMTRPPFFYVAEVRYRSVIYTTRI
ncbi:Uncharacterized protein APZ42_023854 [Daphnia magna]|uniref:Uncharacterized protein n=1 Tax=Daphnia magna TaxID=35525 RepID=A0A164U7P7_9CRUS|nr:Uncharacterized protein APZ42_023854 [Daphnia magna]